MAVVLLLSTNAVARHDKQVQKIPFKLYRNHLVVTTGRLGAVDNANLLIDTGASPTVVDEALAHELGLKPVCKPANGMAVVGGVAQTYYAVLNNLDLGPVHRESLVVAVANLSLMQASAGLRIDAIVGLDALAPNNFQIDYGSRKLVFGSVHSPASAMPMSADSRFAIVEAQVNGVPISLAIDTGTSQLVLFRNGLPDAIASLRSPGNMEISNVAGDVLAPEIQLPYFQLGHEDLSGSTALLATVPNCCEFQGILGISAVRFKRITFDFQRKLVDLELNDENGFSASVNGSCSGWAIATCGRSVAPGFVPKR